MSTHALSETKCLPELWHVQATYNGQWSGYFQFFHPNPEAARLEAKRLRRELGSPWEFYIGRYVLSDVEGSPLAGTADCMDSPSGATTEGSSGQDSGRSHGDGT